MGIEHNRNAHRPTQDLSLFQGKCRPCANFPPKVADPSPKAMIMVTAIPISGCEGKPSSITSVTTAYPITEVDHVRSFRRVNSSSRFSAKQATPAMTLAIRACEYQGSG